MKLDHPFVEEMFFGAIIKKFEDKNFLSLIGVSEVGRTGDILALGNSNGHGGTSCTHFCCICMEKLADLKDKKPPTSPLVLRTYANHKKVIDFVEKEYSMRNLKLKKNDEPFGFSCHAQVTGIFYYSFSNYFIYFIYFIIIKVHFRLAPLIIVHCWFQH